MFILNMMGRDKRKLDATHCKIARLYLKTLDFHHETNCLYYFTSVSVTADRINLCK